jgi:hypothetical protein
VKTGCPPIPAARSTIIIPNDPAITPQAMSVLSTKSGGKYGLVIAANESPEAVRLRSLIGSAWTCGPTVKRLNML